MSVRNLMIINTVWAGVNSLVSILAPSIFAGLYGVDAGETGLQLIRLTGAASVGYAVTSWLMREAAPSEGRTAFLIGGGAGYLVVALVSAFLVISGLGSATTWVGILVLVLLALAFLNYGLRNPDAA